MIVKVFGAGGVMKAPYIVWREEFEVHVASIDEQHRTIFKMLNQLFEARQEGKGSQALRKFFEESMDYAMDHFSHEEAILAQHNYPGLPQQRREHRGFIEKIDGFKAALESDPEAAFLKVFDYLNTWWLDHVQGEDKKYSAFLNERGVH